LSVTPAAASCAACRGVSIGFPFGEALRWDWAVWIGD
jgi:hypothetical protein